MFVSHPSCTECVDGISDGSSLLCEGRDVKVGGDARCCSPGHSAKYGSYSLMDLESGMILAVELVQVTETENSYRMEIEGLKRASRI